MALTSDSRHFLSSLRGGTVLSSWGSRDAGHGGSALRAAGHHPGASSAWHPLSLPRGAHTAQILCRVRESSRHLPSSQQAPGLGTQSPGASDLGGAEQPQLTSGTRPCWSLGPVGHCWRGPLLPGGPGPARGRQGGLSALQIGGLACWDLEYRVRQAEPCWEIPRRSAPPKHGEAEGQGPQGPEGGRLWSHPWM